MVHRSSSWLPAGAILVLLTAMASCSGTTLGEGEGPHDVEILPNAGGLGPNAFSPPGAVISLASQNAVTWYNADFAGYGGPLGTAHHLKSDDGTTFDSGTLAPYGTFQATFTAPGTYTYHCEFHPEMTGTITVNP
jgi:plastocyanin